MFKIELTRRRLLPSVKLPKFGMLPRVKLPQIDLPRVRIDFPEEVTEMEVESAVWTPFGPKGFTIVFRAKLDRH